MPLESILQIDNLCKSFGDRIIFDNLTLNISQGEKVGLIARNGQGKSTLLDVIAGNADPSTVTHNNIFELFHRY